MTNPISLDNFKNRKKNQKVITDLKAIVRILNLSISGLKFFGHYGIVMECISFLQTQKILLEIHLKKYEKIV